VARHRDSRSLLQAADVHRGDRETGRAKVCCPEEIAFRAGILILPAPSVAAPLAKTGYGQYLQQL